MRVVVTGAGLVGCHAASELTGAGYQVLLLDAMPRPDYVRAVAGPRAALAKRDITDVDRLTGDLRRWQAEAVVHTAALVGPKADANPYLAYWVNTGGTAAVAEAARRTGITRLVHISSLAVYDWAGAANAANAAKAGAEAGAAGAKAIAETWPTSAQTVYAASKLAAEAVVTGYAGHGCFRATILRLAGVIGPGRYSGGSQIGAALHRVVAAARDGGEAVVGRSLGGHEYLYAADAGRAVRLALDALDRTGTGASVYNIGTGRLQLAEDVAAAIRSALPGSSVTARSGSPPPFLPLDTSRARRELGFGPQWDLNRAIAALARFPETAVAAGPPSDDAPAAAASIGGVQ